MCLEEVSVHSFILPKSDVVFSLNSSFYLDVSSNFYNWVPMNLLSVLLQSLVSFFPTKRSLSQEIG